MKNSKNEKYFHDLNYSLANEDTSFERRLILETNSRKILSVCGSGGRCLPLITDTVDELICVDLSIQQIWLAKLRYACVATLSYDEFLLFWGYPPYRVQDNDHKRKQIFQKLTLENDVKGYFEHLFDRNEWQAITLLGKWEKTFVFISKIIRKILGEKVLHEMFSFDDLYAQREYFDSKFPRWRWNLIVALLGNRQAFDALLYKGHFVKKNIDSSFYDFYKKSFDHLMRNNLMKASFFLQLCFLGEIQYSEGNPIEADKKVFENIKKNLSKCRITFVQKDLMSAIANYNDLDFISLSDVPSYFNGDLEKSFLQMIKKSLSVKGLIVNRNYLRVPEADRSGLVDIASDYQAIVDSEKVQMYLIEVLKHERKEDPTS